MFILSLFLIAQFSGLLLTVLSVSPNYISIANTNNQSTNPVTFLFWLVINIIVVVMVIMLILRYYRGDMFFKLLEAYIILFGSFFLFFIIIGDILPNLSIIPLSIAALVLSLALLAYKRKTNKMRNVITMITCIGAGIFIGISLGASFGFLVIYLFLGFFAVYDYVAVFVLKFMVPFAKEAVNRNLAFMIGSSDIELLPVEKISKQQTKENKELMEKVKDPRIKSLIKQGNTPVISSIMLGNGDIILPMTLAVGAYALYGNVFLSLMIILGATLGLLVTMSLLKRYKVGLPAIPPLFSFISLFLVIFTLITKPLNYIYLAIYATASILSILAMLVTLRKIRINAVKANASPS